MEANEHAKLLSEREHVCPYIKKHFSCGWKKVNQEYTFKLSVDTESDYKAVSEIFKLNENNLDFSIEDVVHTIKHKPEILNLNPESVINSGYAKTLKEDRIVKLLIRCTAVIVYVLLPIIDE